MSVVDLQPGARILPAQLEIDDRPAHTGGEGSVYFTRDGAYAVKIYHRSLDDKPCWLQRVVELGAQLDQEERRFLAWPLGVVAAVDNAPAVGAVTPAVPPPGNVPLYMFISTPEEVYAQFAVGRSWLQYLKMARGLAHAVSTIHRLGMAHGDIHFKNVLADPATGAMVLIDLDGLIVKGFLPPQVLGLPGFIAPEVLLGQSKPTKWTDRYSAAILILWTLLFRNVMEPLRCYDDEDEQRDELIGYGERACFGEHPSDRRNWSATMGMPLTAGGQLSYRMLTPQLQALTERALIAGLHDPAQRPAVSEWERALAAAYDLVFTCQHCTQALLYPYWVQPATRRTCPFCGTRLQGYPPAIIELLDQRSHGVYVPVRPAMLYEGMPLFADAVRADTLPPFTRQGTPEVGTVQWDPAAQLHRLTNETDVPWRLPLDGGQVMPGSSVALAPGLLISFNPERRLARVLS